MRVVFVFSKVRSRHVRKRLCIANELPVRVNALKKIARHIKRNFDPLLVLTRGARLDRMRAAEEV
jgi:hypothetical protein